jgi:hypothetical protein
MECCALRLRRASAQPSHPLSPLPLSSSHLTIRVQDVPPRLAQFLALQVQLAPDGVLGLQHVGVEQGRVEDLEGACFFFFRMEVVGEKAGGRRRLGHAIERRSVQVPPTNKDRHCARHARTAAADRPRAQARWTWGSAGGGGAPTRQGVPLGTKKHRPRWRHPPTRARGKAIAPPPRNLPPSITPLLPPLSPRTLPSMSLTGAVAGAAALPLVDAGTPAAAVDRAWKPVVDVGSAVAADAGGDLRAMAVGEHEAAEKGVRAARAAAAAVVAPFWRSRARRASIVFVCVNATVLMNDLLLRKSFLVFFTRETARARDTENDARPPSP